MLRFTRRALVALCLGVALSAAALLTWAMALGGAQSAFQPGVEAVWARFASVSAGAASQRYCSNWDFYNNTGQAVNDLHVRLKGVQTVSEVYTGTLNPFGPPDNTSGYVTATGVYNLNFSGAWVNESDKVHLGFCTDSPLLRLDTQGGTPPFEWTLTGTQVLSNPLFIGLEWNWPTPPHLHLQVVNEQPFSMTLFTLNLLDAGNMLALDDLNGDVADQLSLAMELSPTPTVLAPNAGTFFDVYFDAAGTTDPASMMAPLLEPDHPYVLEAIMEPTDDPGNTVRVFSQALSPLAPLYLPVIRR